MVTRKASAANTPGRDLQGALAVAGTWYLPILAVRPVEWLVGRHSVAVRQTDGRWTLEYVRGEARQGWGLQTTLVVMAPGGL